MASCRYNTYLKYTAAYRAAKLPAKDKPFFIEGTFILLTLAYSQDIAAILSVTAKTFIDHFSSLLFYGIKKAPKGL